MIPQEILTTNSRQMKNIIIFLASAILGISVLAETIEIKNPGYFEGQIRDGVPVFPDSLYFDRDAEEISFPDMGTFVKLGDYDFPNLRKVTLNNVDYIPGGTFGGMKNLEEIVVNGLVGHFDCWFVGYCPNLRKIVFNGPVSSTGGPGFKYDCPQLDSVVFNGVVINFGLGSFPEEKTPKFKNYTINGAIITAEYDSLTPPADINVIRNKPHLVEQLKQLGKWQSLVLTATGDNKWMRRCVYDDARALVPVLDSIGCTASSDSLKSAMAFAWNLGDDVKSMLDILKESPSYAADTIQKPQFTYVLPSDSMLTETRRHSTLTA